MKKFWAYVKAHVCKVLIVIWSIGVGLASKEFFRDYAQEQANSHYDITYVDVGMPLVFLIFLMLAISQFKKKKFFYGIMCFTISLWAVYILNNTQGFDCIHCSMGG